MPATHDRSREEGVFPRDLLDHAIRCWEAEVENSRRLAARMNLLLSVILAVLGFGAFQLAGSGAGVPGALPAATARIARILLLGSLILLMRALVVLLTVRVRIRPRPSASFRLRLPSKLEDDSDVMRASEIPRALFRRVYSAFLDLQRRNAAEQARIDRGQQALLLATLHALLAVACYTLFGPPR